MYRRDCMHICLTIDETRDLRTFLSRCLLSFSDFIVSKAENNNFDVIAACTKLKHWQISFVNSAFGFLRSVGMWYSIRRHFS